jgi:uncharacterized protein YndB with AHSA1/START domain
VALVPAVGMATVCSIRSTFIFTKHIIMNASPIIIEKTLHAPVEKVWQALTDNAQMKQWYFKLEDFKAEPGFTFRFEGGDGNQTFVHLCRITEVVPNKKLSHTWQYEGQPEATLVTWELSGEGESTHVTLTHEGLEKIAHHGPAFASSNFVEGWNAIIGTSLKQFVEQPGR